MWMRKLLSWSPFPTEGVEARGLWPSIKADRSLLINGQITHTVPKERQMSSFMKALLGRNLLFKEAENKCQRLFGSLLNQHWFPGEKNTNNLNHNQLRNTWAAGIYGNTNFVFGSFLAHLFSALWNAWGNIKNLQAGTLCILLSHLEHKCVQMTSEY